MKKIEGGEIYGEKLEMGNPAGADPS